jgi:2-iminobutanoate/2-iminopropanoate deaminase
MTVAWRVGMRDNLQAAAFGKELTWSPFHCTPSTLLASLGSRWADCPCVGERGGHVTMSRTIIATDQAPKGPFYHCQAVKAAGLVFVSGTLPYDPLTGAVVGTTIQEQTAQSLRNISAILAAAGTSLSRAVSATVILVDGVDFPGMNEEWAKWFPVDPPARQLTQLPVRPPGVKISIALIAEA